MEGKELVGPDALGAVIGPPVRVKFQAVLTPQCHQAVKDVGLVKHVGASVDLVARGKDVVLFGAAKDPGHGRVESQRLVDGFLEVLERADLVKTGRMRVGEELVDLVVNLVLN